MYPGWLLLGDGDPFETPPAPYTEFVNNSRAYAYARQAGICWLEECLDCPEAQVVVPGGANYQGVALDPAPWYDVDNPDTWGFLGVIGLDIAGAESSTRQVSVANAVSGGGVIGPPYFGPRTLVLHGIAIAEDECSLTAGLNWMASALNAIEVDNCIGHRLTFFDCCPCVCEDDQPGGPCWIHNYAELANGPTDCTPSWWPATYAELTAGPPADDPDWCSWPDFYDDLQGGPPGWTCCIENCVAPYIRHYNNVAVTTGATVLRHPVMYSDGALVEFEITIVAADPKKYGQGLSRGVLDALGAGTLVEPLSSPPPPVPDPFDIPGRTSMRHIAGVLTRPSPLKLDPMIPSSWTRHNIVWVPNAEGSTLAMVQPVFELTTFAQPAGFVRIGLWDGAVRVGGYLLPFIPANSHVIIDVHRHTAVAESAGVERSLINFARDWDDGPLRWPEFSDSLYRVTIDQEAGHEVRILLRTASVAVG